MTLVLQSGALTIKWPQKAITMSPDQPWETAHLFRMYQYKFRKHPTCSMEETKTFLLINMKTTHPNGFEKVQVGEEVALGLV